MKKINLLVPTLGIATLILSTWYFTSNAAPGYSGAHYDTAMASMSFAPGNSDKSKRWRGNSAITILREGRFISRKPMPDIKDIEEHSARYADDIVAEYTVRFRNGSCTIDIYNGIEWVTYVLSPDPCPPGM